MVENISIVSNKFDGGLGTTISYLSMLANTNLSINLYTNTEQANKLSSIKTSLLLDKLTIVENNAITIDQLPSGISDLDKFLAPYLNINKIFYRNQSFPLYKGIDKKMIAFSCYNTTYDSANLSDRRFYSAEEYSLIFTLIKKTGYDVLNLDGMETSISDKIYLMNNFCRAVISYEGGLAHLAHVLKIPSIILPWKNREPCSHPESNWEHRLHLDKKTLLLENIQDVLSWTPYMLEKYLEDLDCELGNNLFLQPEVNYQLIGNQLKFSNNAKNQFYDLNLYDFVSTSAIKFTKKYNPNLKIGGIVPILQ